MSTHEIRVVFTPSGRRGDFAPGTSLLDAARSLGVYVESVCGGRGICGRCQVEPTFGQFAKHGISAGPESLTPRTEAESRHAARHRLGDLRRLGCQARLCGDVVVEVPADSTIQAQVVRKAADTRPVMRDLATHLHYVEIGAPDIGQPLGDLDRIVAHLKSEHGLEAIDCDAALLADVQPALTAGNYAVTIAVHADARRPGIAAIWPGYRERLFGIACDIGSTTLACHLVDLMSGDTIASAGASNPQIRFGEDLMSRVSYAMMNPGGAAAMTAAIRTAINGLIADIAAKAGVVADEILEAVFVGNPVMHHLFLGLDPTPLGQAPFALAVSGALTLRANELGLAINRGAHVYIPPCIAGHVGADAAAVALAEAPHSSEETALIVDVGTNAEIILGNSARLLAASSPTGPAFEGAQISAGQRAAPGAIERVRIDPRTMEPRLRIIGAETWSEAADHGRQPRDPGITGICGSGIIEAIAELYLAGIVTADGAIDAAAASRTRRVVPDGRTFAFVLWDGPPEIRITQADIRAVQLAKGALYAGARLLMERMGVASVDRIRLAGAFGSHIDPKYAMILGLIPDCRLSSVAAVGNAAGAGARMVLLSRRHRREIEALVRRIEKVETALEPRFQALFVDAMAIPNGSDPFPNLASEVAMPPRRLKDETPRRRRRGG